MEFSSTQKALVGSAFDTPSYCVDVGETINQDQSQKGYIQEYLNKDTIHPKMRACVNCIGSCGVKKELLETIGPVLPNNVPIGTGCYGSVGTHSIKSVTNNGSINKLYELRANSSNLQHMGYYSKDYIRNMTVDKVYISLRQYRNTSGRYRKEIICRMHGRMIEIDGKLQLCDSIKVAKTILAERVDTLLSQGYSMAYCTNRKNNSVIKFQDLRSKVKGKLISFDKCSSTEEYHEKCKELNVKYSKVINDKVYEFESLDEDKQSEELDSMISGLGLSEHVKEYDNRDMAISYLFPNVNKFELYRNYVADNIGDLV